MDYSMSDCVNIGDTVNNSDRLFGYDPSDNEINSIAQISESFGQAPLCLAFRCNRNYRFAANAFYHAASHAPVFIPSDRVKIGGDQLKLDCRASAIEN